MKLKKILCAIALPAIIISATSCSGEPELSSSAPPDYSSSSSEASSSEVSSSKPELSEDEYKSSCMVIDYDNFYLLTDAPKKYENTDICYSGYISSIELLDERRYGMFVDIVDNMIQTSDNNYVFNTKTMYVRCNIDVPEREPSKWDDVTVYGTFLGTKTVNEKVYPLVVCKYVDIKEKEETAEPPTEAPTDPPTDPPTEAKSEFSIGETWVVDGQWELTVTGVTETEDRNPYSDKTPTSVYIVDYTYTNIGYEDSVFDGLYIMLDDTIIDSNGIMGYRYPGHTTAHSQYTPVGATCNAQVCIGVDNSGPFKITVKEYDGNKNKQTATFYIEP